MEELIKQAFLHVDVIGPHVANGHYDLIGPNGDIILPQVWETTVEPDWTITMKMWPLPEPPPPPPEPEPAPPDPGPEEPAAEEPEQVVLVSPGEPPNVVTVEETLLPPAPPDPPAWDDPPPPPADVVIVGDPEPKPSAPTKKHARTLPPLLMWTAGSRARGSKKAEKKPEVSVEHDVACRVM